VSFLYVVASVFDAGLVQGLIHSLLALSVVVTLLSLDFPDLSIEGTFPMGAALAAVCLADFRLAPVLVLVLAAVGGAGAGAVTGLLHVRFQMSKLLSGISVAAMLYSLSLFIMRGRAGIPLLDIRTYFSPFEAIDRWCNGSILQGWPYLHVGSILGVLLVAAVLFFVVNRVLTSEFGVVLRAVGINERALRHYGRRSGLYKVAGVALGNGLAALAGALSAQFQGFADVNMGVGVLASSLLAVVLGQELFSRLRIPLHRPLLVTASAVFGALAYQVVIAVVLALGAPPTALRFLSGIALVLVIALGRRRSEVSFAW